MDADRLSSWWRVAKGARQWHHGSLDALAHGISQVPTTKKVFSRFLSLDNLRQWDREDWLGHLRGQPAQQEPLCMNTGRTMEAFTGKIKLLSSD